ncbi:TrmO family methyltransferase domain-containing protein [Micromonospora coxensis]|uniref:TrmO family methyltransferase domain-containing protein n=1 Tax=Micromonospora coxensis TaxID=356852 RepID=UPI0034395805
MRAITVEPVGSVVGGRVEAIDDGWSTEEALIRLDGTRFEPDALAGLEAFSHLEVVFQFHLVNSSSVVTSARHPRDNPDWPKVGIFAQHSPIIDLKPYMAEYGPQGPTSQPAWATELMSAYY